MIIIELTVRVPRARPDIAVRADIIPSLLFILVRHYSEHSILESPGFSPATLAVAAESGSDLTPSMLAG